MSEGEVLWRDTRARVFLRGCVAYKHVWQRTLMCAARYRVVAIG